MATSLLPARRRRSTMLLVAGAIGSTPLLALLALLVAATAAICTPGAAAGGVTGLGWLGDTKGLLTPQITVAINRVSARFGVDPFVVGALAMRETAGGSAIACSGAGACGAMQLMPAYWASAKCDGDGDGRMDINNIADNVCAAVNGLLHDKRTLYRRQMTRTEVTTMARSYCGSCTDVACGGGIDGGYCEAVARNVTRLGGTFGRGAATALLPSPGTAAGSAAGTCPIAEDTTVGAVTRGSGRWRLEPNTFGQGAAPLDPLLASFLDRVARFTSRPFVLTTGSVGHAPNTTNGNVSEHSVGRAGDFGSHANRFPISSIGPASPWSFGDELATAALIAAGLPPAEAKRLTRRGGITNVVADIGTRRVRVQVIWRSNNRSLGGDHTDHVHIGVRPLSARTGEPPQIQHLGP